MTFLGYPISEWSILIGIILTIGGLLIRYIGKKMKRFVEDIFQEFEHGTIKPLVKSLDGLKDAFEKESGWIHDEHKEVVERLDEHDEELEVHRDKLARHEERIKTLFNKEDKK